MTMSPGAQGFSILMATVALSALYNMQNQLRFNGFSLTYDSQQMQLRRRDLSVLNGSMGHEYALSGATVKCAGSVEENETCVEWEDEAQLRVKWEDEGGGVQCYHVTWRSLGEWNPRRPYDCFQTTGAHWFGGSEHYRDHWPMKADIPLQAYVSKDVGLVNHSCGSLLGHYWLSSNGVAVIADDRVPLMYSLNQSTMCLAADSNDAMYVNLRMEAALRYTMCVANDSKQLHMRVMQRFFDRPTGLPDTRMMTQPIWSTWAKYKVDIDQNKTLQFTKEILAHNFDGSQIEIDDKYTTAYGDYFFDSKKFPDPVAMTTEIHNLGFRVTSWVMPFANPDSAAFKEGVAGGYFVMDSTGRVPGLIKWWQGIGAIIDFTNDRAVQWFTERLKHLRDLGIDSFKYDAGEVGFLPPYFNIDVANPNDYSRKYAEQMYARTNSFMEVRVGYKSQRLPVFVRMLDKDSQWRSQRGFDTVIPTALLFGFHGYPFVLPDMIGGNAYNADGVTVDGGALPDKELYIRWLTLNAFLPAMQFSICPWQYDDETTAIALKMVKLHEKYVTPKMIAAGKQSVETGAPIIRPMWWVDSQDPVSYGIGDEFMIGDDVLVAPVIQEGAVARDVYLPKGRWKDMLTSKVISVEDQGHFLRNYAVRLDQVAYFEKMS